MPHESRPFRSAPHRHSISSSAISRVLVDLTHSIGDGVPSIFRFHPSPSPPSHFFEWHQASPNNCLRERLRAVIHPKPTLLVLDSVPRRSTARYDRYAMRQRLRHNQTEVLAKRRHNTQIG